MMQNRKTDGVERSVYWMSRGECGVCCIGVSFKGI